LGGTLMAVGAIACLVGVVAIVGGMAADEEDNGLFESNAAEDDWDLETMGYGAGLALGGVLIYGVGNWIYPDDPDATLHADFGDVKYYGGTTESEGNTLYEDTGYGARRLKKATP